MRAGASQLVHACPPAALMITPVQVSLHACSAGMAFKVSDQYCQQFADGGCQPCSTLTKYRNYKGRRKYNKNTKGQCFECASGSFDSTDADEISWDKIVKKCCTRCTEWDHNQGELATEQLVLEDILLGGSSANRRRRNRCV